MTSSKIIAIPMRVVLLLLWAHGAIAGPTSRPTDWQGFTVERKILWAREFDSVGEVIVYREWRLKTIDGIEQRDSFMHVICLRPLNVTNEDELIRDAHHLSEGISLEPWIPQVLAIRVDGERVTLVYNQGRRCVARVVSKRNVGFPSATLPKHFPNAHLGPPADSAETSLGRDPERPILEVRWGDTLKSFEFEPIDGDAQWIAFDGLWRHRSTTTQRATTQATTRQGR